MRLANGGFGFALILSVLLVTACSDDSSDQDYEFPEETYSHHYDDEYDGAYAADPEQPPIPGWQRGTLRINLNLEQSGMGEEVNSERQEKIVTRWQISIDATSEQTLWMAPDFRQLLPDYSLEELIVDDFIENEPFFHTGSDPEPVLRGRVSLRGELIQTAPNESLTKITEADGGISRLELDTIKPSIHGRGFTTRVTFAASPNGTERVTRQVGGHTQSYQTECCDQHLNLWLHPAPDRTIFDRLVFTRDPDMSEYVYNYQKEQREGLFELLREAHNDALRPREIHPGMVTEVTADRLTLSYQIANEQVIPLDFLGFTMPLSTNRLRLTITLSHDE